MYYCAPEICGVSATIQLDRVIVPSHNRDNSIRRLTNLLGLSCSPASAGTLFSVYINDRLTLDFIQTDEAFLVEHFCFPVDELELNKTLTRIVATEWFIGMSLMDTKGEIPVASYTRQEK